MHSLRKRSFGIIMLLLALVAIAPGLFDRSWPAAHDSRVPDDRGQTCSGLPTPHRHPFLADETLRCCGAAIPTGAQVSREGSSSSTLAPPLEATKRLVGTIVVVLSATLVFIPIPLSNVVPTLVIALISLAYLEEDGVLLSIALLAAVIVLAVATAAVWQMVVGAKWITDLWY